MRQAKKPETKERQNASTLPSKWTCPREQTPATANTSYAVPQRRSKRQLAGSPKPPMESRQAHSIHGVALSRASSRSRCATGSIPTPRCRARPARNAAQIRPQRRRARATPPMAPSMRPIRVPKTEIRPKLQLFCETDRRNGAVLAKDTCAFNANQAEQQHGTTAHRPYKHSCPHPWQKSRASSTEKCNI